jgi:transposase-like protein
MRRTPTVRVVAAGGYWRESTARVMADAWRGSGETVAAFARRHGVNRRRLARWVRRAEGMTVSAFSGNRVL